MVSLLFHCQNHFRSSLTAQSGQEQGKGTLKEGQRDRETDRAGKRQTTERHIDIQRD